MTATVTETTTPNLYANAFFGWGSRPAPKPLRYGETVSKPLDSRYNVECPECGKETEGGMCYDLNCKIGFHNVRVEVGHDLPEDWLLTCPEPEETECPNCGEELDGDGMCWNPCCTDGAMNIGDRQYHEMVDMDLCA